jgi:glutamate formiminotransferase
VFECVVNLAEGRDVARLDDLARAAGAPLRDRHHDPDHHRSVFTLIDEPAPLLEAVVALATRAYRLIDLRAHAGVHPRAGVVDVVPFVALDAARCAEACALRDALGRWLADAWDVPVHFYGPIADGTTRTLPEVRTRVREGRGPDRGPARASASRGTSAVGCRPILVAWNLWLADTPVASARAIAATLRRPGLRTLAFAIGRDAQVSCNVVDVTTVRLSDVYDQVDALAPRGVDHAELVGLAPRFVLDREDPARWAQLGVSEDATIEARLGASAGLRAPFQHPHPA